MASWSEMSPGARTAAVAVVALLLGGGGYWLWQANRPTPVVEADVTDAPASAIAAPETAAADEGKSAPAVVGDPAASDPAAIKQAASEPATSEPAASEPAAKSDAAAATDQPAEAEAPAADSVPPPAPEAPAASAPSIDVARIEPDGSALVAGQAAPGAVVSLMSNGAEIGSATADDSGNFVAMFTLPPGEAGQLLSFMAKMPDGSEVVGTGQIAVAAIAAPVVTAQADSATAAPAATPDTTTTTTTTALAVTDDGVKVLQSGTDVPAEVAANVSLDLIAYPSVSEVQFGGHGAAGSFVRIYLDNAPISEASEIGADGAWTVTVSGIEPKIFTLRVDQLDGAGKVTSRFETPFKRETPEALAAAATSATSEPAAETAVADAAVEAPAAETTATTATEVAVSAASEATAADTTAATPDAAVAADSTAVAEVAPATTTVKAATVTVTVQPGYTLWGIAQENFGDGVMYVQVWGANRDKIRDPDLIYPGQVFTIPAGN